MRPALPPRLPRLLLAVAISSSLAACSGEMESDDFFLSDVGVDAGSDAGTDGEPAARPDASGGPATDTGVGVVDPTTDGGGADGGGGDGGGGEGEVDAGGGGGEVEEDAGTVAGCVDGDGACGEGCYVTTDDDCGLDCRDASTWPPSWVAFEDEVLVLTNQMRASDQSCGGQPYPSVPPMSSDPLLRIAARCHSLDMARRDYFNHFSPEGESPVDRITDSGYQWSKLGENVAAGPPRPDVVVPGWMNSPPHCTGIMANDLSEIGVGYAFDIFADPDPLNDWKHYWTQAFGHPR